MGLSSLFRKGKQQSASAKPAAEAAMPGDEEVKAAGSGRRRKRTGEEPVDPALPEKKRARRRLVGVSALVLAAVVGLPIVLESEPQQLGDDIEIRIPTRDRPQASASVGGPPAAGNHEQAASQLAQHAGKPAEPAPQAAQPKGDAAATQPPEPASVPASAASANAQDKGDLMAAVRARAEEKNLTDKRTESKPAAEKPSTEKQAAGRFVLQVAALSSAGKAGELQEKLSKAGIPSYTDKVSTANGPRIRVRVGPFGTREEAEKVKEKLPALGLDGIVMPA